MSHNGTCAFCRWEGNCLLSRHAPAHRQTLIISIEPRRCTLMFPIHRYHMFQVCGAVRQASFRVLAGRICRCYARWRRVRARRTTRERRTGVDPWLDTEREAQSRAGQARPGSNVPSKSHPLPRYRAYSRRKVCTPLLASTRSPSLSRRRTALVRFLWKSRKAGISFTNRFPETVSRRFDSTFHPVPVAHVYRVYNEIFVELYYRDAVKLRDSLLLYYNEL